MTTRLYRWLAALLLSLALMGPSAAAQAAGRTAPDASSAAPSVAPTIQDKATADYRLGAGDKVRVIVFGEQELTGEFFVAGSGKISMPLVGEVPAAGLTIGQFQSAVQDALKQGFLKDPKVSAEVLNYRPFYILGEVNKPGEYPYTNGLTVLNAVATAGGFTYRANTKVVFIKRANELGDHKVELSTITTVAPGDTIRITERFF
jgi:polysaccharide export outer membrane protein